MRFHALDYIRHAGSHSLAGALLATVACSNYVPEGATDLDGTSEYALAVQAWRDAGLPDPSHCPAPYLYRAPTDEFEAAWGDVPSCSRLPMPYFWGKCEVAFSLHYKNAPSVIWTDSAMHLNAPAEEGTLRHEVFHTLAFCVYGDGDSDHSRADVWASDPYVRGHLPSDWKREN